MMFSYFVGTHRQVDKEEWVVVEEPVRQKNEESEIEDSVDELIADKILKDEIEVISDKPTILGETTKALLDIAKQRKNDIARGMLVNAAIHYIKHSNEYTLQMNMIGVTVSTLIIAIKYRKMIYKMWVIWKLPFS